MHIVRCKHLRLIFEEKAMVSFTDGWCLDHGQLEKIKGHGRVVLLPPNSMCSTRNVGGRVVLLPPNSMCPLQHCF